MRRALTLTLVAVAAAVAWAMTAMADTVADLVQVVDTSVWSPVAPGPAGVAYRSSDDTLIVVDSDRNNLDPFDGVDLWAYSLTSKSVVYTGILPTDEPTGADYDATNDLLFVSDDNPAAVYVIEPGSDGMFGTSDDPTAGVIPMGTLGASDSEDPAYDPVSLHLFVLDGETGFVFDVDPVSGSFGDGDDTATSYAIPPEPGGDPGYPLDWEGLAYDPASGNLLAGARYDQVIYEFTTAGVFVQKHDTSALDIPIESLSGLGAQPAGGSLPITYWVADRGGESDATTNDGSLLRITLGPAPDLPQTAPVLLSITTPLDVDEGIQVSFDADATDDNYDQTLAYSLIGAPTGATIDPGSGVFTWTPDETRGGDTYDITVVVTDDGAPPMSDNQVVQIVVHEVNSPPSVFNPGALLHGEGEQISVAMAGSDPDIPLDTLTWSAIGLPPGLGIDPVTGQITGKVAAGATAGSPYTVTVTVTDDGSPALQDHASFSWSITDTNRSPVLDTIGDKTVEQGSTLSFTATASDPDGDSVSFSLVDPPAGAGVTSGGRFTWTPTQAPGDYQVTLRVADDGSPVLSDEESFTVTVEPAPSEPNPDVINPFVDDDGNIFENAIEWLYMEGITSGCNPPINDRFCPDDYVSRGEMAAFLVRSLHYQDGAGADLFVDDDDTVFELAIDRLATAGVTVGCNPPANDRYCPDDFVTRGQMAAFLDRAFGYQSGAGADLFVDDDGSIFELAIDRLATAGVTVGCNPPANDKYCPNDFVTRGQMAAFLKRAIGG